MYYLEALWQQILEFISDNGNPESKNVTVWKITEKYESVTNICNC